MKEGLRNDVLEVLCYEDKRYRLGARFWLFRVEVCLKKCRTLPEPGNRITQSALKVISEASSLQEARGMLKKETDVIADMLRQACQSLLQDPSDKIGYVTGKLDLKRLDEPESRGAILAALLSIVGNLKFESKWDEPTIPNQSSSKSQSEKTVATVQTKKWWQFWNR